MSTTQLLAFAAAAGILVVTPGADTMLVMRNVITHGRRAGVLTTLGGCVSLFVHATASALGLSVVLTQSALAFEVVKLIGAAYLLVLGCQSLWRALQHATRDDIVHDEAGAGGQTTWWAMLDGFITNVFNPKPAIFYLAFLPQFINPGESVLRQSLMLASIHFLLRFGWLSCVSMFVGQLRTVLTRRRVKQGLEAVTGMVLLGFGVRLALTRR